MSITEKDTADFSASGSLSGYLFQCRYALLDALKHLKKGIDFSVSIETLDDVVFATEGEPVELLQTKHHIKRNVNLTDTSPDLWKTIRIWCERILSGAIPESATFYLITTAKAPDGSAAAYLRADNASRHVNKALERLNATAASSANKDNAPGYAVFKSLSQNQKSNLFDSVFVLDGTPTITGLDTALREEVFYAVEQQFLDSFLQRLEGWWFRRSISHLAKRSKTAILSEEFHAEMTRLREQFKQENLTVDDDILNATVDASGYQDCMFVHQLRIIKIGNTRIFFAIREFFRAFEQRSRWIREDLIYVGELDRYERELVEEWEYFFEQMKDELGEKAAEEEKKRAAHALYKWVETGDLLPIRANCTNPSIARGSYHILSDSLKVGWHPEFVNRLRHLLETQEVAM